MKKQIVILTDQELNVLIKKCITETVNEIGGRTLSVVPNVAIDAVSNIQQGNNRKQINPNKDTSYDEQITKADALYPKAIQSFLAPYKNKPLMFFAYRRTGNPVHLLFTVEDIKKMMDGIVILSGEVVFGNEQLPGDIMIDITQNKVYYKYKGNGYKYILEPDNRTSQIWQSLCNGIKDSLSSRLKRG